MTFRIVEKMEEKKGKSIFVTVGTTLFDALVEVVCTDDFKQVIKDHGYSKLTIQYGKGVFQPPNVKENGLTIEAFRYRDSISENIKESSLVISHAGAGSCVEVLAAGKPLVVVVNEALMDNHQLELAKQLNKDQHSLYCVPRTLAKTVSDIQSAELRPFPPRETEKFGQFLDSYMGLA